MNRHIIRSSLYELHDTILRGLDAEDSDAIEQSPPSKVPQKRKRSATKASKKRPARKGKKKRPTIEQVESDDDDDSQSSSSEDDNFDDAWSDVPRVQTFPALNALAVDQAERPIHSQVYK